MNKDFLENICPLSPMQQGMLFHTLYSPEAGVYVQQFTCTLHGAIQIEALKQAWQQTVNRHAALRTVFIWENRKEPVQVVYRRARMPIQELDWRDLSPAEQQ
ncbi:MAG: hypothetical protein JOZ51_09700, partial [Chloroflexi bacterium]|nr:hypothetical protein [Chloroflexota bacterium]